MGQTVKPKLPCYGLADRAGADEPGVRRLGPPLEAGREIRYPWHRRRNCGTISPGDRPIGVEMTDGPAGPSYVGVMP
ncbi:MAG: hypothetical protein A2Z66_08625 [Chloroflexi bacterium RBG_13_66_10]|nr:MAG: hypothetical protein A2Z66_08625 [Chloroflexi bacterium RBG_13_66_10]